MTMFGNGNQSFELFAGSRTITCEAGENIIGSRFVKLAPGGSSQKPKVVLCGAGERPFGVSAFDQVAGQGVSIHRVGTYTVTAGEAITAPAPIASGAAGVAVAATGTALVAGQTWADAPLNTDTAVALAAL